MSSTQISGTYPYLPPTTNVLDPQQRARLIRSTRKLGKILGTTPYLLESDVPVTVLPLGKVKNPTAKALKRQGSIFTHRPALSSPTSFTSASSSSLHDPSPSAPVVSPPQSFTPGVQSNESLSITPPGLSTSRKRSPLHVKSISVTGTPTDDRSISSSLPSTPSRASVSCFPPSPCSPGFPSKPDRTEIRRRQMAKLTRHLGEKVPAELLSSSSHLKRSVTSPERTARGRSFSVGHALKDAPFMHANKPSVSQTRQDWVGEWNRSDIRDVQKELRHLKVR